MSNFEERLTHLAGRFGVVIALHGEPRLYLDSCGMIGAHYNATNKVVAASTGLCLSKPPKPDSLYVDQPGAYGLDYTQDSGTKRLNPNHYLDLKTFETHRFWPRNKDVFHIGRAEYAAALDEIILASRNIVTRHVADNCVSLPLTGGFDSRSILAVADDDTIAKLDQVYTHVLTWMNLVDVAIANQLSQLKGIGLEVHNALRKRRFTGKRPADMVEAQFRIANLNAAAPHPFIRNMAIEKVMRDAVVLRGQQMPILRGLFIDTTDEASWTPQHISDRFVSLLHLTDISPDDRKDFDARVAALHSELPKNARRRALDLLLVEAVNGPDLTGWYTGVSQNFYSSPFNSRRLIQLFASFETRYRQKGIAMNLLLLRADPVLKTVAMAPGVKKFKAAEDDASVKKRKLRLDRQAKAYENIFGEMSEDLPLVRYRTDGTVDLVNPKSLDKL